MVWLFYFLAILLFLWAILVLGLVIYSYLSVAQRSRRALLRASLQATIQQKIVQFGSLEAIDSKDLVSTLLSISKKDRNCLRDCLVEYTNGLYEEEISKIRETYDQLGFLKKDIDTLQKGNWIKKSEAAIRLGRIHCASAIEVITALLRDDNKEVRLAAVCALADIGDLRSVPSIIYALADADGWQVLQVADKLLNMQADITRPLLDLLQASGSVKERRELAQKTVLELIADFGHRGSERLGARAARLASTKFLSNDSVDMRARAIRAIAAVGIETNDELDLILNCLSDKDWPVRAVAAKALGQLQQEQSIPALTRSLTDEAWWVRHNAAHSLAMLGTNGLAELRTQTLNPDRFARDIAKQVLEELQLDGAAKFDI
ncbi:MAG: HEAT repeat domain-containing protein [Blastocatellia bacterium]|nr:HEAT repeat domain-containing protein [Blastocatellia bacterium]MBL8195048.1 HEAT repeat domain-containing protein [Blastocatellia bacterium]MBN8723417.1 HEAT repeat domain-containing protein [Acidobacteriota bacterium]